MVKWTMLLEENKKICHCGCRYTRDYFKSMTQSNVKACGRIDHECGTVTDANHCISLNEKAHLCQDSSKSLWLKLGKNTKDLLQEELGPETKTQDIGEGVYHRY
jgi:hypothetical protein